jgi:hypothetical protein
MTDDLITKSKARIRGRTVFATVLAALIVLVTVTVSLHVARTTTAGAPTERAGITLRVDEPTVATPAEISRRKTRLQRQLVAGFERILPKGWQHSTFDFDCDQTHCWAEGDLKDSTGTVKVSASAWADVWLPPCLPPNCRKEILADGTLVSITSSDYAGNKAKGIAPVTRVGIVGLHPNNTSMDISAEWPPKRKTPPLPAEQWTRFAPLLTY